MSSSIIEELRQAVIRGKKDDAENAAKKALQAKIPPLEAITNGLAKGVREVGDKFGEGEIFLVELMAAGKAMKAGMSILLADIKASKTKIKTVGKVVIGTVQGDIHSIGKDIVATMLEAYGFEVINLGEDVPVEVFLKNVKELKPDIVGMSSLITSSMPVQKKIIDELKAAGLRDKVKVIIGGAPTTDKWARDIGADGWAGDAVTAASLARRLVEKKGV
jgi:corrinoid protein of di/trimethylamine methyltransferase